MLGEVELWRRLEEAIIAELNARCDGIVSGNLETIERYRFETGMARGLQWVLDRARDLVDEASQQQEAHEVRAEEEEDAG